MSSSHHAHVHVARHSPPNVRKVPAKAPRSATSSKTPVTPNITIKLAKAAKHAKDQDLDASQDDEDDDMASSFLQFWSGNAILFPFHPLPPLTESVVQCVRSRSSFPTRPSSTVQRGTIPRFHSNCLVIDNYLVAVAVTLPFQLQFPISAWLVQPKWCPP